MIILSCRLFLSIKASSKPLKYISETPPTRINLARGRDFNSSGKTLRRRSCPFNGEIVPMDKKTKSSSLKPSSSLLKRDEFCSFPFHRSRFRPFGITSIFLPSTRRDFSRNRAAEEDTAMYLFIKGSTWRNSASILRSSQA